MTIRQQADQQPLQQGLLPHDHLADGGKHVAKRHALRDDLRRSARAESGLKRASAPLAVVVIGEGIRGNGNGAHGWRRDQE